MKIRYAGFGLALLVSTAGCRSGGHAGTGQQPPEATIPVREARQGAISKINLGDPAFNDRIGGFYPGTAGWMWTSKDFWMMLDAPLAGKEVWLELDFATAKELIGVTNDVTIDVRVNGMRVARRTYTKADRFLEKWKIPAEALRTQPAKIEVSLDKAARRDDGQPLGLIVISGALVVDEETQVGHDAATVLARAGYDRLVTLRNKSLPPERQREMMKLFHDIPVWREMWFQNVRIEKNPLDLWMLQQMIYELRPDFIIETGTWRGGSALFWAYTLNGLGLENSRVFTVDIQNVNRNAAEHPLWKKYVTFLEGSSTGEKIVSQIKQTARGRKNIVMLDSDHRAPHVLNELHAYADLVPSGSYLIVEDTHLDGIPSQPGFGPGPTAAVEQFLKEPGGAQFTQDLSREAFLMTFNPGGWLKRK